MAQGNATLLGMSSWRLVADIPVWWSSTKMWGEGWKGNGEHPLLLLNFMVHRHSLTFRHSQREAHIPAMKPETSRLMGLTGPGRVLSAVGVHFHPGRGVQGMLWWAAGWESSRPAGATDQSTQGAPLGGAGAAPGSGQYGVHRDRSQCLRQKCIWPVTGVRSQPEEGMPSSRRKWRGRP